MLRAIGLGRRRHRLVWAYAVITGVLFCGIDFTVQAATVRPDVIAKASALETFLRGEDMTVVRKEMTDDGFILEYEPQNPSQNPSVRIEWAQADGSEFTLKLEQKPPAFVPQSVRSRIGARLFASIDCTLIPELGRILVDCGRVKVDDTKDGAPAAAVAIALRKWEEARQEQSRLFKLIEAGDVQAILRKSPIPAPTGLEKLLIELASQVQEKGYYTNELFLGDQGAQINYSTAPDAGLFVTLYIIPLLNDWMYTTVFDPAMSFGGVASATVNQYEDRLRSDLAPQGCLDAFSSVGYCNSYVGPGLRGRTLGFDFKVDPFETPATLDAEINALKPHYERFLNGQRLQQAAPALRPAQAAEDF